jgi:hypothetical protein
MLGRNGAERPERRFALRGLVREAQPFPPDVPPDAPLYAPSAGLQFHSSSPAEKAQPTSPDAASGTLVASPNVRSTGVITPSDSWLLGWWSVDGYCEGDAGQTFAAQGRWGEWAVDGEWRLSGDRLTVTKLKRMFDTASGGPEPISPAEVLQGRMTNIQSNSFQWMGRRMVRCD